MKMERILVPVDFSASSQAALQYAAFLAGRFDAQIDVLHVWEPPHYVGPEATVTVGSSQQTLAQFARTAAGHEMEAFLADLARHGIARARGRLEAGDPARTILEVIAGGDYDLVVMGTHGRTGLARMLMGSVAEKVVRAATRPVLVMRHSEGTPV